ncbi:MAG: RNA ligase family protein [bacterium]
MHFRKYEKIHRLGKEEVAGILQGTCSITEKIDGANLSVWLGDGGEIRVGSRNNDLTANGNEFNGAVHYCNAHEGIKKLLTENPSYRLYGEWLVRHTLSYNNTAYKKFYLFDIYNEETKQFLEQDFVQAFAKEYGIDAVPDLGLVENPTVEQLNKMLEGVSAIGEKKEGIVIRNMNFKNTFGDMCYAKLVREDFKEDNGIIFGGNNKHSDCYWEMYICNKYIDVPRVQKIMNKIQPEVNEKLDMKHIPRIIGTVYHDLITEEAWEIANKAKKIDYDTLKRICQKKAKQVYIDILNDSLSVADLPR